MAYLIDTDWVVDWLYDRQSATTTLTALGPSGLAMSVITVGELYEGIYNATDPKSRMTALRRFQQLVKVLPVTTTVAKRFARLRADLRRLGQLIPDTDLLIAATALHHDLTLITRNNRHFARVTGLRLFDTP